MNKFVQHRGIIAPLIRDNVDTDAIIPSREMRSVSKTGLSDGLFATWRYLNEKQRLPNPEFVLNQDRCKNASILLGGDNFGCGSSREHAVWALKEYGFRVIIAQSFGSIFYRNCINNGILPVQLNAADIHELTQLDTLNVNLNKQTIETGNKHIAFVFEENDKRVLLLGLDPISETLNDREAIEKFDTLDRNRRPWMYEENVGTTHSGNPHDK